MSGTLYGLGVGPGDPELLTLKAARLIAEAPVIAYPQLGERPSFARAIAAAQIGPHHTELAFTIPMRADDAAVASAYDRAAADIEAHLAAGRDVAVLCEGDAFLYGSFAYLWRRLAGRHPCQIVPGVSSLVAASARLAMPLASGGETVSILPASLDDEALAERILAADMAAILKVGRHLPRIARLLARLGLAEAARYVERVTLPDERAGRLADFAGDAAPYFSILLVPGRGARP